MKLELKHLVGYLPYGLKVINVEMHENGFKSKHSIKKLVLIPSNLEIGLKDVDGIKEKPILRPLSDLTKEIEVNGEKFVPLEKLAEIEEVVCLQYSIEFFETSIEYLPHWIVEKLYEWHFDIHGLIDNNLAIDKNT